MQFVQCLPRRMQRQLARTERVFIAGQLDDVFDAQFALQLLDRFADLIGLEGLHARGCQGNEIAAHGALLLFPCQRTAFG